MYTRRARVCFQDPERPELAQLAKTWANAWGSDWVEAFSADQVPGQTLDLWVIFDASCAQVEPLSPYTRCKSWILGEYPETALETKIRGMLGGFRLLARLDDSCPPPR